LDIEREKTMRLDAADRVLDFYFDNKQAERNKIEREAGDVVLNDFLHNRNDIKELAIAAE